MQSAAWERLEVVYYDRARRTTKTAPLAPRQFKIKVSGTAYGMRGRLRGICVDLDGVLVDTMPWHAHAWREALHARDFPEPTTRGSVPRQAPPHEDSIESRGRLTISSRCR